MKFDGLSNPFGLIDCFLTLHVSRTKAERGFLILKSLKPSQRQTLVNIDGLKSKVSNLTSQSIIGTNIVYLNIEMGRFVLSPSFYIMGCGSRSFRSGVTYPGSWLTGSR